MVARLYIEGGGDSKELRTRCREGFRKLLERAGFAGRMPRLVASGARHQALRDFSTAVLHSTGGFVALLVDSEDPIENVELPLDHIVKRDGWVPPATAVDDQILLMVTCMETWIIADRPTLRSHFGSDLEEASLPPLVDLERRDRQVVQNSLARATRKCSNAYRKGKRSYEILGELDAQTISSVLPSLERGLRLLDQEL